MATDVLLAVIVIFCLALSFLLSGMEAGVFALNRLRIRHKMRAGDPQARLLFGYLENPENFLWTILVGNTLTNFVVVLLVAAGMHHWLAVHKALFWSVFSAFIFLLYALGDLLPKMLFQSFPNRLCLAMARPFRFVHLGLAPLVALLNWFSLGVVRWTGGKALTGRLFGNREELRLMMQESAQGLSSEERSMINRVLDFQVLTVGHETIPLEKVTTVGAMTPMATVLKICRERNLTRLLVEQNLDGRSHIIGIVSLKTILYQATSEAQKTAGDYVKPALFVDEDLRLEEALRRMQRSGQRLAIVLGRDRCVKGVLSLQDILKAIFGEVSL